MTCSLKHSASADIMFVIAACVRLFLELIMIPCQKQEFSFMYIQIFQLVISEKSEKRIYVNITIK